MRILVTGATGYIGGSLVEQLRDAGHDVTGLARSDERADFLRGRGVAAVVGGLADRDVLASVTRHVDVVVNTVEADDVDLVRNLVAPIEGTGRLLVQTSGSSIVVDDAGGAFASEAVFDDDAPYDAMLHRAARIETDRMVRTAGVTAGMRTAVICPATIYGEGTGWKRDSHQIPLLVGKSVERGAGVYIGAGKSIWSNIFLGDVLDLYARVIDRAPSASFFFAENGEASWAEVARSVPGLVARG